MLSEHTWLKDRLRQAHAAQGASITDVLDAMLKSEIFDTDALYWLAHRSRIADVKSALVAMMRPHVYAPTTLLGWLNQRHVITAVMRFRMALAFGVYPEREEVHLTDPPSPEELRRTAAGRLALAACGEMESWGKATRDERAAFVLWKLTCA